MTTQKQDMTEESADGSTGDRAGLNRRPFLKAIGVGATLSLGGGLAAATDDESSTEDDEDAASQQIHPVFGLPLAADEDVPDDIDPAHVVEVDVAEEENFHEGFPLQPDPENPDQFVEADAEFLFDPVGLRLAPGDVVHYDNLAHLHTVTAFHEKFGEEMHPMPTRVPEGVPGFTSPPFVEDESWLYEFTKPGVYDILCLPHLGFGMVHRVVVSDEEDTEAPAKLSEAVPPNAQTVLSAPELDPQQIVESGTVAWSDLTLEMGPPAEPDEGGDAAPTVQVGDHAEHGDILVGPDEMTLYMFDNDTRGEQMSACQDDCADAWPPLTVEEEPVSGDGVTAALATFKRETGETQVMADGWPLYYFARDEEPGDANGQGVSDVWWVLGPDGTPIKSESNE